MTLRTILFNGFVKPLQCRERATLYLSSLLASIGFCMFDLVTAFDAASAGMLPLLMVMTLRFGVGGMIFMPLGFLLINRFGTGATFLALLPLQALAALAAILLSSTQGGFMLMVAASLFVTVPFWLAYHALMMAKTTGDNRGNEVTFADMGLTAGAVIGSLAGGLVIASGASSLSIALPLLLICGGTAAIANRLRHAAPSPAPSQSLRDQIFRHPARNAATVLEGACQTVTSMLCPVWLKILGFGGMAVGVFNALNVGLKIMLAPFSGAVANRTDGKAGAIGALSQMMGWMPWAALQTPLLLPASCLFWTAGAQLYSTSLMCRWYEQRSLTGLAAREIMLGLGRFCCTLVAVPLLYQSFTQFVWLALLVTALMTANALLIRRRSLAPALMRQV